MYAFLGCPLYLYERNGNRYWFEFAIVLVLLTWGVIMRRRERIQPRRLLHVLTVFGWFVAFIQMVVERYPDGDFTYLALLKGAAFTTGCVFLEIVVSPRKEPVPQAIARETSREKEVDRS